jgi:hypothetical protein
MKVTHYDADHGWAGRVDLDAHEWPSVDTNDDTWLSRPIYQWAQTHCFPVSFSYYGMILFGEQDDLTQFVLTWS